MFTETNPTNDLPLFIKVILRKECPLSEIIYMNKKFLCEGCKFVLKVSRDNVKKSQKYGGVFCPKCGKRITDNEIKKTN